MPDQENQVHSVKWAESLVWTQARSNMLGHGQIALFECTFSQFWEFCPLNPSGLSVLWNICEENGFKRYEKLETGWHSGWMKSNRTGPLISPAAGMWVRESHLENSLVSDQSYLLAVRATCPHVKWLFFMLFIHLRIFAPCKYEKCGTQPDPYSFARLDAEACWTDLDGLVEDISVSVSLSVYLPFYLFKSNCGFQNFSRHTDTLSLK